MRSEQRAKISASVRSAWAKRRMAAGKPTHRSVDPHSKEELPASSDFGEDPLRLYFADLDTAPKLLTREEEVELFIRIEKGDKEAFSHLIAANVRLVVNVALKFQGKGLETNDIIQCGNLGLIRAVEKFDWRKGFKFSTYAMWWIRQSIDRSLSEESRTIRFPVHLSANLNKMRWIEGKLRGKLGREPTEMEIAKAMKISIKKVRELMRLRTIQPTSLNQVIAQDEGGAETELGQILPDSLDSIEDAVDDKILSEKVHLVLRHLTPRERRVLILRLGLNGGPPLPLMRVSEITGIARERVRTLERQALRKLADPAIAKALMVEEPSQNAPRG